MLRQIFLKKRPVSRSSPQRFLSTEIRSIDMRGLTKSLEISGDINKSVHDNRSICTDIVDCLSHTGFLYLQYSPISPNIIRKTMQASTWLFELPEAEKNHLAGSGIGGAEYHSYYRYMHKGGSQDNIEAYNLCNDNVHSTLELRKRYYELAGFEKEWMPTGRRNSWPQDARFRSVLLEYWRQCEYLTGVLFASVESACGMNLGTFAEKHTCNDHTLELKKYPAISQEFEGSVRIDEHADLSTFTILIQDAVGGLQIYDMREETWLDVPARPDAVLINSGDFLRDFSAGKFPSTRHRVVAAQGESSKVDRISCVFFASPDWHARVEPLLEVATAEEADCTGHVLEQQQGVAVSSPAHEPHLAGDRMPM
mmetsp:Transcript_18937/g.26375  ORF Transcript_18937/g.26375 Transcript_18937/m.26375 type:complete len:367 (-) Transcript_18937:84-1184(-)